MQLTEKDYRNLCCFYYEGFIDSLAEVEGRKQAGLYGRTAHLTMDIGKDCTLSSGKLPDEYKFKLRRLHLFFFPYDIVLYAIEIDETGADLNALTTAHSILRDVSAFDGETSGLPPQAPEFISGLNRLLGLCKQPGRHACFADLTETGNKLKVFQIVSTDRVSDELLFELGTLAPIGCVADHNHHFSPSQSYYEKVIKDQSVSVFRNWKALALFDTVTVLAEDIPAEELWLWPESYFRLIYIHALYQKTLLFRLNRQFRSVSAAHTDIRKLVRTMKEQEHYYAFSNISYNFLPQTIYRAIDAGLDVGTERKQLHGHLEQEAALQEKASERKLARLLFSLTVLTVLSAIYDGSSLFKDLFGFETGTPAYQYTAVIIGVCAVCFIFFIILYNNFK